MSARPDQRGLTGREVCPVSVEKKENPGQSDLPESGHRDLRAQKAIRATREIRVNEGHRD